MTDIITPEKRSVLMAKIRSKNTKPEILIRKRLFAHGFRYKIHTKLPGKPDIVLKKYNAIIFVHGCFWHGHDCHLFVQPKTRSEFWSDKIDRNRLNDIRSTKALKKSGWRVATIWECSIRGKAKLSEEKIMRKLISWLLSNSPLLELKCKL